MLTTPDYPWAVAVPADPSNYRAASRAGYSLIVIHCTDGHGDPHATAEMWTKGGDQGKHTSAHFVIGQDGTVIQAVALKDVAQHAHAANGVSVGVEHCARTPHEFGPSDPGLPFSDAQLRASAKLVAWLLRGAGLPCDRRHVLGHAEADPQTTHEKCPVGPGLDWTAYMALVQLQYESLAPHLDA